MANDKMLILNCWMYEIYQIVLHCAYVRKYRIKIIYGPYQHLQKNVNFLAIRCRTFYNEDWSFRFIRIGILINGNGIPKGIRLQYNGPDLLHTTLPFYK